MIATVEITAQLRMVVSGGAVAPLLLLLLPLLLGRVGLLLLLLFEQRTRRCLRLMPQVPRLRSTLEGWKACEDCGPLRRREGCDDRTLVEELRDGGEAVPAPTGEREVR
jgi:hypothetical protein